MRYGKAVPRNHEFKEIKPKNGWREARLISCSNEELWKKSTGIPLHILLKKMKQGREGSGSHLVGPALFYI